ncbi:hypothetical protein KY290_004611 [Solanum tuberosum]|uniref:Uncharacterized protein n=1 Tax=Solanum tuberosum TaxID=4113 RepID=A0ABQ7WDL4_SOLTU|nr:hypothetical protein KY284_004725 [Solanum tuberosum]KAH0778184.1 hypothetical protein KY290_004611 [Solanum tuberosum]
MVAEANRLPPSPEEEITNTATSRLAFAGDATLGLAISSCLFVTYLDVDCGKLTDLHAANVRTEKLARVAVRHGLYNYLRGDSAILDEKIKETSLTDLLVEKEIGPAHDRRFICSVQIRIAEGMLFVMGDEKSRVKKAENSAALTMIRSLQESKFS